MLRDVPWEESHSPTFSARHDSSQRAEAAAVLESLEAFRHEVDGLFERAPGDIAVVLHPRAAALTLAHPWLPLARMVAASARCEESWRAENVGECDSSQGTSRNIGGLPLKPRRLKGSDPFLRVVEGWT